jgi:hypothetical protein
MVWLVILPILLLVKLLVVVAAWTSLRYTQLMFVLIETYKYLVQHHS